MNRASVGIEHAMQGRADVDYVIAQQTTAAIEWLVQVKFCRPTYNLSKEIGALSAAVRAPAAANHWRPVPWSPAKLDPLTAEVRQLEVWQDVICAIDHNLRQGNELWWPLADTTEVPELTPLVPLRPSLEDLRAVWLEPKDTP